MAIKQPYVIRAFYNTKSDAETAVDQLESIDVYADWVGPSKSDHYPFKIIFTDTSANLAKTSLRRISTRPTVVQVFDPLDANQDGWADFKTTNLN
jgi:hypothetical protein